MGWKKRFLCQKALSFLLLLLTLLVISSIIVMSMQVSAKSFHTQSLSAEQMVDVKDVKDAELSGRRVRRDANDGTWELPTEVYPITVGVPANCDRGSILSEFPNATCFSRCLSSPCDSDVLASIKSGDSEMLCTARIILLGFPRSGTREISRWIRRHPAVTARYADIFMDNAGKIITNVCPLEQLRDTTAPGYFESLPLSSVGAAKSHKNYYLHCEHCITTSGVGYFFGSLFLDLLTSRLHFMDSVNERFIITMKNPTDRAIAEYFYPHIMAGTDLTTVGNQVLHEAMSAGIEQAKSCMTENGPAVCVFGHNIVFKTAALDETRILYDGCYSTHLTYVLRQISLSRTYFVKIEEYLESSGTVMQEVFDFIGLEYNYPPPKAASAPTSKPMLSDTIAMLDEFFEPFNRQLRDMLGNDKWLYIRD
ncbi:uncharacterized protein [Watersipora subatra]|uniref:uncharacterized protein n=1 Tax=Watersipora subatra TaxID=2589382 RepID=UPI00355AF7A2